MGLAGVGRRIALIGATNLVLGDFDPLQAVPKDMPGRAPLFWSANGFLLLAGAAVQWSRLTRAAALAIALYYGLVVAVAMNGAGIVANAAVYGAWFGAVTPLALAVAGAVLAAERRAAPIRAAQCLFGLCALFYGGAHFVYPDLTVPLVPAWLPPSQLFWADATGLAHIVGGLAILSGFQPRRAAIALTAMYASFTPLVHLRLILGDPHNAYHWTENAVNIALAGAAWVMADSLGPQQGKDGEKPVR